MRAPSGVGHQDGRHVGIAHERRLQLAQPAVDDRCHRSGAPGLPSGNATFRMSPERRARGRFVCPAVGKPCVHGVRGALSGGSPPARRCSRARKRGGGRLGSRERAILPERRSQGRVRLGERAGRLEAGACRVWWRARVTAALPPPPAPSPQPPSRPPTFAPTRSHRARSAGPSRPPWQSRSGEPSRWTTSPSTPRRSRQHVSAAGWGRPPPAETTLCAMDSTVRAPSRDHRRAVPCPRPSTYT